jgi:UDP-galactopyranose mutase
MEKIDALIVGAGLAGLVMAERLANEMGWRCVVVDRRPYFGGNCHDRHDDAGVLIHSHGPHYFRTNAPRIVEYLSRFTAWHPTVYRVLVHARGRDWSFPVNLRTFEQLMGRPASSDEFQAWLETQRVGPSGEPANSEEAMLATVGREFYELFFADTPANNGAASRTNSTPVFARASLSDSKPMIATSPTIFRLCRATALRRCSPISSPRPHGSKFSSGATSARSVRTTTFAISFIPARSTNISTISRDRSLRFEAASFDPASLARLNRFALSRKVGFWQSEMQINYPGDELFTRIVELKHATGQVIANTTIVREYPADYGPGREPYYPIPAPDSLARYRRYAERAALEPNVSFVGRLATYRYYNMDQVVGMALTEFEKLRQRHAGTSPA